MPGGGVIGRISYRLCKTSGIDPEIMPRLFSKFATKSQTGTGLVLFFSQNIVEAHGGKIWGENNKDGEACICIQPANLSFLLAFLLFF
jgi:signal transduction histidine kinase